MLMADNNDDRDIRTLWSVHDHGDHLTTPELRRLVKSAESGLSYLRARGENLAAFKTSMDLHRIQDWIESRARGA